MRKGGTVGGKLAFGQHLIPVGRSVDVVAGDEDAALGREATRVGGVEGLHGSDNHVGGHAIGELVDVDGGLKEKRILVEVVLRAVVVDKVVVVGAADW